jgi:hypothetical protein
MGVMGRQLDSRVGAPRRAAKAGCRQSPRQPQGAQGNGAPLPVRLRQAGPARHALIMRSLPQA